jgi:hypothetical protein
LVPAALVNSSWKLDADVPSPGQFDHVIGYLPQGKKVVWLDTMPEVAPFGYLVPRLRDKEALVMSARLLPMRDEARDRQVLSARRIRFPRGLCHCRRRLVVWYIIPAKLVVHGKKGGIRLHPSDPTSKYAQYKAAWDLLR